MKRPLIVMTMLAVSILSFVGCQSDNIDEPAGADNSTHMEASDSESLSSERGKKGTAAAAHGSADGLQKNSTNDLNKSSIPQQ